MADDRAIGSPSSRLRDVPARPADSTRCAVSSGQTPTVCRPGTDVSTSAPPEPLSSHPATFAECTSPRDFERLCRHRLGLSQSQARALASVGWRALHQPGEDQGARMLRLLEELHANLTRG